jgi:hypothetical protein
MEEDRGHNNICHMARKMQTYLRPENPRCNSNGERDSFRVKILVLGIR